MIEERIKTDVLCIGGGIAGLMAAIRAAESGASVVVAEKGNVEYSGCGRMGNDHFETYIPEIHGPDRDAWIEELLRTAKGEILIGKDLLRAQFAKAYDIVTLWNSWGIPMKYRGRWEFAGHSFPGRPMTHIKYAGRFQKKILTKEAKKRGVTILNRVMMLDLIRNRSRLIGAVGVHTREDKLLVFEAKAVVLGTGKCSRLYPPLTPGWLSNDPHGGSQSGDGRAMAYRAGAMLQNLEMPQRHIGPKYFARFGQATWIGVVKDWYGKPAGTFVSKPDRRYGDMICEVNKLAPEQYAQQGKGPLYMDCTDITEADHAYMMHWMGNEGYGAMTEYMAAEGIDFRKHPIEFMTYPLRGGGLVVADVNAETSLKGLYAAGDEAFGDISAAATFGYISGENAAAYARNVKHETVAKNNPVVREKKQIIDAIRGHENGPDWEETSIALQQTMLDYAGMVRNESLLRQGLQHLRRIRQKAVDSLVAKNPHEVTRCLEVMNLLELGELTFLMALNRRETRNLHRRPDYPFTDPTLNQAQIVQRIKGDTILGWKPY
ncbi:MAG: FAD-binding protein [Deltaproteobacteria bacterium]|nr:FAD-binding protein [Deltaproteobacteria bacterium]